MIQKRHLRAYAVRAGQKPGDPFPFVAAAASGEARDGLVLDLSGMDLANYKANRSPLLFSHNYQETPVGTVDNLRLADAKGLIGEARFHMKTDRSRELAELYAEGVMNAFSIGWRSLETSGNHVTKSELLDVSAVSIPSDPLALAEARSIFRSLRPAPLDLAALRNLTEAEAEAFLRELHRLIVVEPAIRAGIEKGINQWLAR